MVRYLVRRVLWAIVLCFVVSLVTFALFFLIPNDLPRALAGAGSNQEQRARAVHYLGIDRPVYVQYSKFVWRLVEPRGVRAGGHTVFVRPRGDLGRSFRRAAPVGSFVARAAPITAVLVFGGALMWILISLPIGILCALRPGSVLDRTSMTLALIGISTPTVWMALIFSFVFGYQLGWFPIQGYCDFFDPPADCNGARDWAYHMFLPWLTFALTFAAYYVRMIRANVLEVLPEDYVRTARAKGAPEWRVLRAHILRNALLPVVTMLGMDVGLALGGTVFIETIFGLPGLGRLVIRALNESDLPIVTGVVLFASFAVIVANLIVDLLYAVIDPRIRVS